MAKNKNIKKSKPKIDLNSNESKPKIEKENIEVSRNIQVDTSSKGTKSAGDLNIKFDTYKFFTFPSNYFLILIIYFSLIPLLNIASGINIHNRFVDSFNNSSTMKSYAVIMNTFVEDLKSSGKNMVYKPIKIEYNLSNNNSSIDFNGNKMVLFNDIIYKEVQAGRRKIKSKLSNPLAKYVYVDGELIYIRFDNLPISIPTHDFSIEKEPVFRGKSMVRIFFYDNDDVSLKSPKSFFYKDSTLKSIIKKSQLSFSNRSIRKIEILREDGMFYVEIYKPSGLPSAFGYYDIYDKPLGDGRGLPFIAGSVYDSGRIFIRIKNKVEEAVLYSNIFRGLFAPIPSFIDTSVSYYRGSRTERLMNFIQKDFDDIVENNSKDWNSQQSKKILDIINKIEIK